MTQKQEHQTRIPKLRFREFQGEWEKVKLGNQVDLLSGFAFDSSFFGKQGKKLLIPKNFSKNGYGVFNEVTTKYTTEEVAEKFICHPGDLMVLITDLTPTCELLGNPLCLKEGDSEVLLNQRILKIIPKNDSIVRLFLLNFLQTSSYKKIIIETASGSTVRHSSAKIIGGLNLLIPSPLEQQKIASFLSIIDEKIEKLKTKKSLLEKYKKGVMQKIFSPDYEIRFRDKNGEEYGEWEEKKLGEIGTFRTSSIDKKLVEGEKEVYLVNYMNVYRHEELTNEGREDLMIVTARDSQIENSNLRKGDILFTPSSETPDDIGHSVVIFEDLHNTVYSYHVMRFRPSTKLDLLYSHYFCNIPSVLNQLTRLATGSTRFTISVDNFSRVVVSLPPFQEQQKIASFLSEFDKKIELLNTEIESSQKWKKGLLQQMFI